MGPKREADLFGPSAHNGECSALGGLDLHAHGVNMVIYGVHDSLVCVLVVSGFVEGSALCAVAFCILCSKKREGRWC